MARSRHWYVLLVTAGVACGKHAAAPDYGGDSPANQALMRKANGYLSCHEAHTKIVFRLARLYRDELASAPHAPTPTLPDVKPCLDAIAAAKAMQPAVPELDAAGEAYGVALATIYRLVTSYDRSQAARLDAELLAAFDAFDRAQPALFDQLYTINRRVHLAQFAKRQAKEGRTPSVLMEEVELRAEDLVRFAATPARELDKLDVSGLIASLALFERSLVDLEAFEARNPDAARTTQGFKIIVENGTKLAVVARELAQRARDNVAYTDAEKLMISAGDEANVIGTPGALVVAYNRMIDLR